jgi:hypothetical protein
MEHATTTVYTSSPPHPLLLILATSLNNLSSSVFPASLSSLVSPSQSLLLSVSFLVSPPQALLISSASPYPYLQLRLLPLVSPRQSLLLSLSLFSPP